MKKKGFTLIELLAVIMILAIIALIVGVTIGNIIEKTRREAYRQSVTGIIQSAEHYIAKYLLESNGDEPVYPVTFICNGTSCSNGEYTLEFQGGVPKSGSIIIESRKDVKAEYITDGKYCVSGYIGSLQIADSCSDINGDEPVITNGATKVEALEGETHKGIVYLDPTNLSAECNATNSVSTTETKTGCMKWYIYKDNGNSYSALLDHNTSGELYTYTSLSKYTLLHEQLLIDTRNWDSSLNPTEILDSDIQQIIGFPNLTDNYLYFDTQSSEYPTEKSAVGMSPYEWLVSYTEYRDNNDSNSRAGFGYITKNSSSKKYHVSPNLYISTFIDSQSGVRPSVTVPKSVFN